MKNVVVMFLGLAVQLFAGEVVAHKHSLDINGAKKKRAEVIQLSSPNELGTFSLQSDLSNQANPHEIVYKPIQCHMIRVTRQTDSELADDFLTNVLAATVRDLTISDQFDVVVKKAAQAPTKSELQKLSKDGVDLAIVIEDCPPKDNDHIDFSFVAWKTKKLKAVLEKKACFEKDNAVLKGHCLSREIMKNIGGNEAVCLTTLAFCEAVAPHQKNICLSDYAGMYKKTVINNKAINVAPSFHTKAPLLFFSELTKRSNKLKMLDLNKGDIKTCCGYPGLNMQCKVSKDGAKAVLCMSGGKGNSELFMYDQNVCNKVGKRVFKQLTFNGGTNCSPTYLGNGDVVFCSDFESGKPQIYYLDTRNRKTLRITNGKGYCAAPSYCEATKQLVFTRSTGQSYQLYTIDMNEFFNHKKTTERQLTFGIGDKNDPVWSPNGDYVAFVYDIKNEFGLKESQIAVMNKYSKRLRVVTSGSAAKSFPAWCEGVLYL